MTQPDSLYLLGAPGVGKSTVLAAAIERMRFTPLPEDRVHGRLIGHPMYDRHGEVTGLYLGRHREQFPGTDGLSMAVAPDAREWARGLADGTHLQWIVGEGARLGNVGFLRALGETTRLTLALLTATEETLTERRDGRGSTQTPSWMRGAATAARNAFQGASEAGAITRGVVVDTTGKTPAEIVEEIDCLARPF